MSRPHPRWLAALVVAVTLAVAVTPVVAHTNHVEADDQLSADGTLVLEWEFVGSDGWVAVRADDDGEPGAVLGHRRVSAEGGFRTDTTLGIDGGVWANWTDSRSVWVVLHRETGGEGFDPDEDPLQTGLGGDPAGSRITVERADGPASVTAQAFQPETSTDGTVTVRRVELHEPGYVAVRPVDAELSANAGDEALGDPVGVVQLDAGVHENVTVALIGAYLAGVDTEELLSPVVYTGTEGFDSETTEPVTAGDELVRTTVGVEFRGDVVDGSTPTPTASDGALVTTPEPTATPSPTPTSETGAGGGVVAALLALALTGVTVLRRVT
jgi:hypothetical protein